MSINLTKGANVNLTKEAPGLAKVRVGLGWDLNAASGAAFDLDASCILVGADDKALNDKSLIFYGNKKSENGAVEHLDDNLTGEGDGDDETIKVDLSALPAEVVRIPVAVSIYEASTRKQNFGMVRNAFIRIINDADGAELAKYDLSEDASTDTGMVFGELYKKDSEWKFRAVGQSYADLAAIIKSVGLNA